MTKSEKSAKNGALNQAHLIALARTDFYIFVLLMFSLLHGGHQLKPAPYIKWICYILTRSGRPELSRVIFNMPPGFMKSLLISVLYVAWRMGVNPSQRFICASYGDELAYNFGRKTRQVIQSDLYRAIFPETVLTKTAENFLETSQGGARYATNVGGDIAGFRADCIILDDPMQPDDAHRAERKKQLVDWYLGVAVQRLLAGGFILVVMHRIAPDDFCGTLEENGGWHVVKLPLICEERTVYRDHRGNVVWERKPGDLLSPLYRGEADIAALKRELNSHTWDGQCQQRPRFGGNGLCSIDRLRRYTTPPPFELTIHSWDLAGTKDGGNYTVGAKFGLTRDATGADLLYLTAILRLQVELPDVREIIAGQDDIDKPALVIIDANGIGAGIYQDLERAGLRHLTTAGGLTQSKTSDRKLRLFFDTLPQLYDGRILIPETMPGLSVFLDELASFPEGKYDDQVDALTVVGAHRNKVILTARQNAERYARWTRDHRAALERDRMTTAKPQIRSRYFDRNG